MALNSPYVLARGHLAKQLGGLSPARDPSAGLDAGRPRPEIRNVALLRPSEAPVQLRRRLARYERRASLLEADAAGLRETGEVVIDGSSPRFAMRTGRRDGSRTGPPLTTSVEEMTETLKDLRTLARQDPEAAEALLAEHPGFAQRLRAALP